MLLEYLELGKIVNTHGVRGELKVDPWCDDPSYFDYFEDVFVGKKGENSYYIENSRPHGNMVLLKLEGIDDMDQANLLRNKVLYVRREDAPIEEGRYFVAELIGCTVSDADTAETYGTIQDVTNTGATDIWHIKKDGKMYYMPLIPGILVDADVANNKVTVRPIPGIFTTAEEIRND